MIELNTRLQNKIDTSSNWTNSNPVLLNGELGIESDTGKMKVGDGFSYWLQLEYVAGTTAIKFENYVHEQENGLISLPNADFNKLNNRPFYHLGTINCSPFEEAFSEVLRKAGLSVGGKMSFIANTTEGRFYGEIETLGTVDEVYQILYYGRYYIRQIISTFPIVYGEWQPYNLGLGDMVAEIYDTDGNGVVDNAEKVGGKSVEEIQNYDNLTNKPISLPANDVYAWAKEPTKPTYSSVEVGLGNVDNVKQYSASNPPPYPVTSVNGQTGAVTLDTAIEEVYIGDTEPTDPDLKIWWDTKQGDVSNDSDFITNTEVDIKISNAIGQVLGGSY